MSESYWDYIEDAYYTVSIYETSDVYLSGIQKYPSWFGDLLAVHWTLSEISNGGLAQFFINPTGILAPEAVLGFNHMNLLDGAEAVAEAMSIFGSEYPRDQEDRTIRLAALTGFTPENEDWNPFHPSLFESMEKKLYLLGGSDFGKIYDAMDSYAKINFKNSNH